MKDFVKFDFPKIKHKYPLSDAAVNAIRFKPPIIPSTWIEKEWGLSSGYSNTGKIKLHNWQKFIVDSYHQYDHPS